MNFLELTKNRYSCRNYKAQAVEKEKLEYVMECVRMAPSASHAACGKKALRVVNRFCSGVISGVRPAMRVRDE